MKIFGFSGLGADERVFNILNTKLKNPITPIPWIAPSERESIEEYATRISQQLANSEEGIILIGISFGGIIATEIAKTIAIQRLILISSASTLADIPWYFKLIGAGSLIKNIPEKFLLPPPFLANWFFSVKTKEHKDLLKDIIKKTDLKFARWAIQKIFNWQNSIEPDRIIRIHGTRDRVLPITKKTAFKIDKGGHFMIIERVDEIAEIINHIIDKESFKI